MHVRDATIDDAEALALVHVHGWQWGYRGLLPSAISTTCRSSAGPSSGARGCSTRGARARGSRATKRRALAGFVAAGPSRDPGAEARTGEIYALYIEEAAAGSGVGRALLERAVDGLRDAGFARATLWVLRENARARRFYEKAGWTPDGAAHAEPREDFVMDEVRYAIDL